MDTSTAVPTVPCPTCATPVLGWAGPGAACPNCGLPAAGHAGFVVARIDATLTEFRADRERLLQSLAQLTRPATAPSPAAQLYPRLAASSGPVQGVGQQPAYEQMGPQTSVPAPAAPAPPAYVAPPPPPAGPRRQPRRLSPQQMLLGTGAVLLVSAAIAFAAVAWQSLSVAMQAIILLVVTAVVCAASVSAARRGLRTTAEALAMAGLALTVVDLVGARAKGLAGLDDIPLRAHAALTLGAVVILGLALNRLAPTTKAWLVGAIVAAQPLAFLALPDAAHTPVLLVATSLLVSVINVAVIRTVKGPAAAMAIGFGALWWAIATILGTAAAWSESAAESVLCTLLVTAAGGLALLAVRPVHLHRVALLVPILDVTVLGAGALALAGTLHQADLAGAWSTGVVGLAILTTTLLLDAPVGSVPHRWQRPATVTGALLCAVAIVQLAGGRNWMELAALAALAAGCSASVAVLNRGARVPAAMVTAVLPAVAVLLLVAEGLAAERAGWMLALLGASTLGVACVRVQQREERPLATTATMVGLTAGTLTATTSAWGQLALQMSVIGAGLLAYGRVARHRPAVLLGLADLVLASWVGAAGISVTTPEVYTLPAVAGLLFAAGRALWTAPSWTVWGAPLLVGLLPSTLLVLDHPEALRLVLVVTVATVCAVLGTVTHRQAPFLIGLGVLLTVAVSELGPYAALLPRWLSLGMTGIVLLALGATYERRLSQAKEAIAWVGAMR